MTWCHALVASVIIEPGMVCLHPRNLLLNSPLSGRFAVNAAGKAESKIILSIARREYRQS